VFHGAGPDDRSGSRTISRTAVRSKGRGYGGPCFAARDAAYDRPSGIADADLTRASFYWDSVPHFRNPPSACQVRGRAIPCSDGAKQRHDIIPNRLALTAEESVSGVTGAAAQVIQETPPMRISIIGNDGITLCREPPATVNKGDALTGALCRTVGPGPARPRSPTTAD
jgi:hypothetical protein